MKAQKVKIKILGDLFTAPFPKEIIIN